MPVNWVVGPSHANLGTVATVQVPAGFKFTDASGARRLLPKLPSNAIGLLTPEAGGWVVLFSYSGIGYVSDTGTDGLDADSILKTVRSQVESQLDASFQQGKVPITGINWAIRPNYDSVDHSLEWALTADSGAASITNVNHTIRLLGRHGILEATAVVPGLAGIQSVPLKSLAQAISFNEGERYADYRAGDKPSRLNLAQLIATDNVSIAGEASGKSRLHGMVLWAVVVLGVGGAVASTVMLLRKRGPRPARVVRSVPERAAHEPVAAPDGAESAGPASLAASRENGGSSRANGDSKPPAESRSTGRHHRRGSRRRKSVDYTRFFMDLRSTVSDHSSYVEPEQISETPAWPETPSPANGAPVISPAATANSGVIAQQRLVIEEQQRLIQEQTKLIEEKTRLLAEKSALLARQAELIDERLLPS